MYMLPFRQLLIKLFYPTTTNTHTNTNIINENYVIFFTD